MNTRRLLGTACLLVLPLLNTGCVTYSMWNGYTGTLRTPAQGEEAPVRVLRAARSGQGQHRVEVEYAGGARTFTFWPQDVARAPGRASWDVPRLEPAQREMPAGLEAGWIEVGVEDGEPWPTEPAAASCPELEASSPPRVVFRLREDVLEFREGHEKFRPLAKLPRLVPPPADDGPSARDVALGALVVVATPVTVALDVSLGGVLFALALI